MNNIIKEIEIIILQNKMGIFFIKIKYNQTFYLKISILEYSLAFFIK